ncbi:aldo/keto reductase [Phanerochaete sordida]|uniref:Aldo/keto reductase n=1 Tax=Phanerochaete sordida TaxID=48140 RepID=A0A9P3G7K1_9APHY|nr:aldo/keto reductase [Phanerochaete sordida]
MSIPSFPLNDGRSIPALAFGSGTALYNKDASKPVAAAIRAGFRHIDAAQVYANEQHVGAGIAAAGVPRAELFVTTKLDRLPAGQTVRDTLLASNAKLGVEHVDLFLIHMPNAHPDLAATWREMEAVQREGLARTIGVSNFLPKHLEQVLAVATIKPAVNQIEYHPYVFKASAAQLEIHKQHGIVTESYGGLVPLTRGKGGPLDPVITKIASARSITEGQVLQLWLRKKGVVVVTTTTKQERLEEYLAVGTLPDLSDEEVEEIERVGSSHHHRAFCQWIEQEKA